MTRLISENPLLAAGAVLLLAAIGYFVTRWVIGSLLVDIAKRTSTQYDDIIIENLRPHRLAWIASLLIIYSFAYLTPDYQATIEKVLALLILWIIVSLLSSLLNALNEIYESRRKINNVSIQGYLGITRILIILVALILSVSIITGKSPVVLLSGLGAITAILLLVFRDTLLSFVASLQISAYDLLKEGDWVEVPSYGADGDVIDISLHTIKIQNFDKTITIIPTYKMVEVGYKNWRGMQESGGRRIKRAISLDLTSLRFCDLEDLKRYQKINLIQDFVSEKITGIESYQHENGHNTDSTLDGPQVTNATVFRAYMAAYLRSRDDIYPSEMTFLVRELAPQATGLPVEMYIFTKTVDWVKYENIQGEIMDHLIAAADFFDLRVFQEPTGRDMAALAATR